MSSSPPPPLSIPNRPLNSSASPAPYPEAGREQQDAVRRRALPIAIAGVICGLGGLALLLVKTIDEAHPPAVLAVNLSFCAMMMGVGILFYARGVKGTGGAAVASALAIAIGLAGPMVFMKQSIDFRKASQDRELGNVQVIADAARNYAVEHGGKYPTDLGVLLEEKRIAPMNLHSPYAATPIADDPGIMQSHKTHNDFLKYVDAHSDYEYFGGDLKLQGELLDHPRKWSEGSRPAEAESPPAQFSKIILASSWYPIMRTHIAVGFADGRADFVTLEDAEKVVKAANEGRARLGFAAMRPPESVSKAMEMEGGK